MKEWKTFWEKNLLHYMNVPPRTGIFIHSYFKGKIKNILEVACGSGRDSIYLAKKGYTVVGVDYEENIINYLKTHYENSNLRFLCENAFEMGFMDDSFDLVFHNGFFIYFNSDEDIFELLKEQERISRKYICIFVHNIENQRLVKLFHRKSKVDEVYNIRFFDKRELGEIVRRSGINYKELRILKFGGFFDSLYSKRFKRFIPNPVYVLSERLVPHLYSIQRWKDTERLCLIIELNKEPRR